MIRIYKPTENEGRGHSRRLGKVNAQCPASTFVFRIPSFAKRQTLAGTKHTFENNHR